MVNFKLKHLNFSYSGSDELTLKDINLEIDQGEFVVICGRSGSGKSTLLSTLKPELTPKGDIDGELVFFEKVKDEFSQRDSAENIGFMLQNAEYQTVTHTVRSELVFGLENLGLDDKIIKLRIAEIVAYFSLENIIDKKTAELSGGQKQLVCLASIVAMHPKAIILDEPTSQLDPVTASSFLQAIEKLCRENGMTVIITEHRLENVIPTADRVIIMESGRIISDSKPEKIPSEILENNEFVSCSVPFQMKLYAELKCFEKMPLTVSECHKMLGKLFENEIVDDVPKRENISNSDKIAVEMKNVNFAYDKTGYVLKNMKLSISQGSFTALMGANGVGKTTALMLMSGILKSKSGKVKIFGKDINKYQQPELYNGLVAVLPQKCESLFAGNTIREDLQNTLRNSCFSKSEIDEKIEQISKFTEITQLLDRHPYDVSGGEMQRAALTMVLLKEPKIIFLDEPTKGMDNLFKKRFAQKIRELCEMGITAVMVSHDTEFCAEYCDECAMIFDGNCVLKDNKYDFFAQNYFYTTAANKISRGIFKNAVTQRQVLDLCQKNLRN